MSQEFYVEEYEVSFDKSIRGSFGEFETNSSYILNYMMATIDIQKLKDLKTASNVLNFNETKFEELVQRDVDYTRVEDEIIDKYLRKGENKFIFFPPLLISPMVTDANGKIIDVFSTPEEKIENNEFVITYDSNFQIKFPYLKTCPPEYPYVLKTKTHGEIGYYNYATKFEYNSDKVNLIVIDGQHRLMALKSLYNKNPEILTNIKIPICLFFAPEAFSTSEVSLTKSMRQLFITINSTAKQVSGHFITLLNDESLSSYVVREFADSLKDDNNLHLLEWNERKDKRISQLNKSYSITTVSILDDALKTYVLKNSLTFRVLNLTDIHTNLYEENKCSIDEIDFDNENFFITDQVKKQIRDYLVSCLKELMLKPNVFKIKVEQLANAIEDLEKKAKSNKNGARSFIKNVLYEYREYQERFDADAVQDIQKEFLSHFSSDYLSSFYYKNVFQQAYIKTWINLFDLLSKDPKNKINILSYTTAFVRAMEKLCFDQNKNMFNYTLEYNQNVIYKNSTIKVSKTSKEHLSNLIKSTFLNKAVLKEFEHEPFFDRDLLISYARNAIKDYFLEFQRNAIAEIKKNWRGMFDSEEKIYLKLDILEKNINIDNNQDIFDKEIEEYTTKITQKAKNIFSNIIEVNYEDIGF